MTKRTVFSLMAMALTTACLDMDVENLNAPDAERALAEADDVQALLGTGFYQFWSATQKHYPGISAQVAAGTQTMSWGNFGAQHVGTQPRLSWDNSPTFGYRGVNETPWGGLYTAISNVNDGLNAMDNLGIDFTDAETGANMNNRARAYAKFIQGISHGYLAMYYDQAMIFDETTDLEAGVPEMVPYTEVMDAAIGYLEESIDLMESNTFALPGGEGGWILGIAPTNEDLLVWAHTFMARYLSGVARTPAERAAAPWPKIIEHARKGYAGNAPVGPLFDGGYSWWDGPKYYAAQPGVSGHGGGWNRASLDLIGLADTSGAYQTWKNTPPADRQAFIAQTRDRRIVGAAGGTSDGKYVTYLPSKGGLVNQYPAGRGMYFQSGYNYTRFNYVRFAGAEVELMPIFTEAEMDLLEAEGLLRTGNKNAAIDLINKTRVGVGELPALPYSTSSDAAFQVMMYEKLIETTITWAALPYFDKRGWGTLICGTPLHYPVPGTELEQLQIANYTFGGVGGEMAASQANGGCQP